MPSARFEHAIPAIKGLQSYALDLTATGIGKNKYNIFCRYLKTFPSTYENPELLNRNVDRPVSLTTGLSMQTLIKSYK